MNTVKKNVLIVDNSPVIIERVIVFIGKLPNIGEIHQAAGFDSAVSALTTEKVDIAIIDIHLDEKSGLDLLPIIKEQFPEVVVIMFTNQTHESYQKLTKKLGASYFLDKSKDFPQIPAIMAAIA